jgi:hypothetical protein
MDVSFQRVSLRALKRRGNLIQKFGIILNSVNLFEIASSLALLAMTRGVAEP